MNKVFSKRFEIILLILFFVFSSWLMHKSFGYDSTLHKFRVARHQLGDFGFHLSIIRSFSLGDNGVPAQSPFFPGKPIPYHYFFDLMVGILERLGVRVDIALNGLSAIFFAILLFFIYKLPQVIFGESKMLGVLSVMLFIFHSGVTVIDFFKDRSLGLSLLNQLWRLPDYLYKGPFDGSIISIFFTLNVYLNQRHFIAALAICLGILYFLLSKVIKEEKIPLKFLIMLGFVFGATSRIHTITFLSTSIIIFLLFIMFKRFKNILLFFVPALLVFYFHLTTIISQNFSHPFLNLGFLAKKPLTLGSFFEFWFLNLGIALILIPLGVFFSNSTQRKIFLCVLPLFVIGNLFQLSFLIDHNHSIFNYFFIFASFFIAFLLIKIWRGKILSKLTFSVFIFFLTSSGFIDLMVVKNDYQYHFWDAPQNAFMQWIKTNTKRSDIFISRQEILDPVTLAGRKNFLGHKYFLTPLGYEISQRELFVREIFEGDAPGVFEKAKDNGVRFIVLPRKKIVDFNYNLDVSFYKKHLKNVYQDDEVLVFQL